MSICSHTGKKCISKKASQTFINEQPERRLRKYACDHCGGWHLTHKPLLPDKIKTNPIKHGNEFLKYIKKE